MIISRWNIRWMRNVSGVSLEKIKTYIFCSITIFRKSCRLWDNVKKMWYRRTGHRRLYNMAHALCVPDWLRLQTHRMCEVMSGKSPQLLRMCCANFSKPATGSSTMHTAAVNATTSASGARNSERCDAQDQRMSGNCQFRLEKLYVFSGTKQ